MPAPCSAELEAAEESWTSEFSESCSCLLNGVGVGGSGGAAGGRVLGGREFQNCRAWLTGSAPVPPEA